MQTVIARLESGRICPSTKTLERFAQAIGIGLRIELELPSAASL
jgi:ribosome-binding protein aMBF1 (putative translation factor)